MTTNRLVKAKPIPTCKIENDCMMMQQDNEVSWPPELLFSKRGSGLKIGKNFHFSNVIANF